MSRPVDDPTITEDVQEYVVPSRERDLFHKLKAIIQDPPLEPFLKNDFMWLPHLTSGLGLYREVEIVVIPWSRLEDFVEGEQNNLDFPCKFTRTKDHFRSSTLCTLTYPKVNFVALVYKCGLCTIHPFHSNVIILWMFNVLNHAMSSFLPKFLSKYHNMMNFIAISQFEECPQQFHFTTVVVFVGFLVTSNQKTEPMFFQRKCRSFYYLLNKNKSKGRSMMHP